MDSTKQTVLQTSSSDNMTKSEIFLKEVFSKLWEFKWMIIPVVVLGYGYYKKQSNKNTQIPPNDEGNSHDDFKSSRNNESSNPKSSKKFKSREETQKVFKKIKYSFKEGAMTDDVSTASTDGDRERRERNARANHHAAPKNVIKEKDDNSGYHSDAESFVEKVTPKGSSRAKSLHNKDLFFGLYSKMTRDQEE